MTLPRRLQRRLISLAFTSILLLSYSLSQWILFSPPPQGGSAQFYSTHGPQDLRLTYVQAIERAQSSLLLMIYGLNDQHILNALRKRAAAGVKISILYDPKASQYLPEKLPNEISLTPRLSKGLMHQKILVVDEKEVWIGSANMTTASLRHHANLCMGVQAPALAEAILHRAKLMHQSTQLPSQKARIYPLSNEQSLAVWWLPNPKALEKLESQLDAAQKSIRVAMYTWTHPRLGDACVRAHQRGVDVKVVIDGEAAKGAGSKITELLVAAGIPLRLSKGPALLHHKFTLIDSEVLIHGSANWTRAAFKRNDEILCVQSPLDQQQVDFVLSEWHRAWREGRDPL